MFGPSSIVSTGIWLSAGIYSYKKQQLKGCTIWGVMWCQFSRLCFGEIIMNIISLQSRSLSLNHKINNKYVLVVVKVAFQKLLSVYYQVAKWAFQHNLSMFSILLLDQGCTDPFHVLINTNKKLLAENEKLKEMLFTKADQTIQEQFSLGRLKHPY